MKRIRKIVNILLITILISNLFEIYGYSFGRVDTTYESNKNYRFSQNDINSSEISKLYNPNNVSIPSQYSLKNVMNISVANQLNLDFSNVFATVKSVETNYALKHGDYVDLSERYIDYMTSIDFYGETRNIGDSISSGEVMAFLETFGTTTESEVPYENYSTDKLKDLDPVLRVTSCIELPNISGISNSRLKNKWLNIVKAHIMKYGSITTSIASPEDGNIYNNKTHASYYKKGVTNSNSEHTISIIGWDDNYSRDNFLVKPENDGAFICLNSYGEDWGDRGLFYVSYNDDSILISAQGVIDVELCKKYNEYKNGEKLFTNQYWTIDNNSNRFYGMKFTKNNKNEFLSHITIGVGHTNINDFSSKVKCYINTQDDSFDKGKMILLEETNSILSNTEFTNINLNIPIRIEGDRFSLVFEFIGDTSNLIFKANKDASGNQITGNLYSSEGLDGNWNLSNNEFVVYAFTTIKDIVSINLKKEPNKTTYIQGEDLELKGCRITVQYDNGDVEDVELSDLNSKVIGYDSRRIGKQIVTVMYQGRAITFGVEVKNDLREIEIKEMPTKRTYIVGEELDLTGGIFLVTYEDGSTAEIPMTSSEIAIFGYDLTKSGQQDITLTYQGKSINITIEIKNSLKSIEIKKEPVKTTYIVGENIDLTGGILLTNYEDGSTAEIPMTSSEVTLSGYDATMKANQLVTITYQNKSTGLTVTVRNEISGISMQVGPDRETYLQGENLDITGGKLIVAYEDGINAIIPLSSSGIQISNYNPNNVGEQVIKVSYKGKSTEFKVQVNKEGEDPTKRIIYLIIRSVVIFICILISIIFHSKYKKWKDV